MSVRTSLEEGIKLHRFAGIFPEQFSTEAGRHREAVAAADQRMVIRRFRDVSPTSSTMFLMCRLPSNAPALLTLHSGDIMKAAGPAASQFLRQWRKRKTMVTERLNWSRVTAGLFRQLLRAARLPARQILVRHGQ